MSILNKQYWLDVFSPQDILKTTIQTIVGTVLIGSFFMVASDYIFPAPDLHGRWEFTTTPTEALSKQHSIMQLTYTVRVFQEGNKLRGVGEKIRAVIPKNSKGITTVDERYSGNKRVRIQIEGYIENNYFAQDKVKFFYTEGDDGRKGPRKTATIQSLNLINNGELTGNFDSTISDSTGKVTWKRIGL